MKIRTGFVSNSSSSSFIVRLLNTNESKENIIKHNMDVYINSCGDEDITEDYVQKIIHKEGKIIYYGRIDYGSEDCVDSIVNKIFFNLGYIEGKDFTIEMED